ncbi:hypothetical protein MKI84_13035 [Ancylobacter sp. A5.8]|uniref:hypothetical protein n=1 Tax=Ancylobacter gelatini TaxID=2919920 RepID=UPI001F4E0662|nr:hypothetical protein [Ancylobacter gelatini]MCJ8143842.1 hypothetical protein [Ancylobacter gelatini]
MKKKRSSSRVSPGTATEIVVLIFFIGLIIGGICVALLIYAGRGFPAEEVASSGDSMTYADFSAIMLGAAGLIVTVIGVFVGILAIWGYTQLMRAAQIAAETCVEGELDGTLGVRIMEQVDKHLEDSIKNGAAKTLIEAKLASRAYEGTRIAPSNIEGDENDPYGVPSHE